MRVQCSVRARGRLQRACAPALRADFADALLCAKVPCMAKLIYSMITSLDGYTEDDHGDFGWGAPDDGALHSYINELASSVGTYLYGRKMYDTMVYWETAHTLPDQPQVELDWARQWQRTDKIVYSRTLSEPRSARTRIEREFEPDAVRRLKASSER